MARPRDDRDKTTVVAGERDREPAAWQLVVIAADGLRSHALPPGREVVVGRTRQADIQLDDPSISRRHGVLRVGAGVSYEDLGGANGTRFGDRRLAAHERVTLAAGDALDLGDVMVVLQPRRDAPRLVIDDHAMAQLHRIVDRVAVGTISVLLLGETGVGKEVMARLVHDRSPRRAKPFVSINCAALSEQLLESELFGHEKGAFTGADRAKAGLLESADGGTLFLDEVGEMPLALQAKLLRVLEAREVQRVGALRTQPIDVRFVAATNRDLQAQIAAGAFRSDLYFRLNGISLVIPPLRERRGEIAALARGFVAAACAGVGRDVPELSDAASALLASYAWPGNIRELKNAMERAALLAEARIEPEHLGVGAAPPSAAAAATTAGLHGEVEALERARILETLERCGGNQSRAAAELGLSRNTLAARLRDYGIKPRPRAR
nr:sigma 54-interacting transcriptional regulator [Kofleriaceae bacterium]